MAQAFPVLLVIRNSEGERFDVMSVGRLREKALAEKAG